MATDRVIIDNAEIWRTRGQEPLGVYVPHPDRSAHLRIAPASAIVGMPKDDEMIECYYEGNIYDLFQLRTYASRVRRAAERLVFRYPTVARGVFHRDDLVKVGTYVPLHDYLRITNQPLLERWLGIEGP